LRVAEKEAKEESGLKNLITIQELPIDLNIQ
jgi:hypothetical protein